MTKLELNNIYFGSFDIISEKIMKYVISNNVECDKNLIDSLENYDFAKRVYINKIKYEDPFMFDIKINKEILINIKSLKNCISMNLGDSHINDNAFYS